jgi:hypothetical protein
MLVSGLESNFLQWGTHEASFRGILACNLWYSFLGLWSVVSPVRAAGASVWQQHRHSARAQRTKKSSEERVEMSPVVTFWLLPALTLM